MARNKTIANLRAILGLDSKKFNKGIDSAGKRTKKFKKNLGGIKSTLKGLAGPLAAAFSVVAVKNFASETLRTADAIGKLSARIGVATGVLQELEFAFDLTGVQQENLNKGLLTFGKRIGKARGGTGALNEGLKKLDPSLLATIKSTSNQTDALEVVFDAMANARNEAERLAIADAAFGEAGLRMASAFEDGADAFKKARERARELGIVIHDDLIQNAEQLNDDINIASRAIGIHFKNAFLSLADPISQSLDLLTDFLVEAREANRIMDKLGNTLTGRLALMQTRAAELDDRIAELRKQLADPIELPGNLLFDRAGKLDELEKEREALAKRIQQLKEIVKQQGLAKQETKSVTVNMEEVTEETEKSRDAAKNFTDELGPVAETVKRLGADPVRIIDPSGIREAALELKPFNNNIQKTLSIVERLNDKFDYEKNFNKEVTRLQQLRDIGLITPKIFDRAMAEAIRNMGGNFSNLVDVTDDSMSDIVRIAQSAQGQLEQGFQRTFDGIINNTLSFREVVSNILGSLASSVFSILIGQPLAKGITGGITDFFGDGAAMGGRISGPTLVGEQGPEIFVPNVAGSVVPNHDLGGGGGVQLNQSIHVDARGANDPAMVDAAVQRGIAKASPQLVQASVEAVRSGRLRDPKFFGGRA